MIDDDNTTATELARARAFILQLADRIAICSELLGKRAEKRDATTRGLSMFKCPRCNGENFRVRDTKHVGSIAIKRYRKCRGVFRGRRCDYVLTTLERPIAKYQRVDSI